MGSIQLAQRRVSEPATTGIQPLGTGPQPARRVGIEMEQLGKVMSAVGGQFSTLMDRIKNVQARNEVANSQLAYGNGLREKLLELSKDPDHATWVDKFGKWHDEIRATELNKLRTPAAKNRLSLWFKEQGSINSTKIALDASKRMAQNDNALLDGLLDEAVKTGDFKPAAEHAVGMIADDNLLPAVWENKLQTAQEEHEEWVHKQAYQNAYNTLLEVLTDAGGGYSGLRAVDNWLLVPENTEGLREGDRAKLKRAMILEDSFVKIQTRRELAERTKETVDQLTKSVSAGDKVRDTDVDVIEDEDIKKDWRTVVDKPSFAEATNYSALIDLQDKVLSYLLGEDDALTEEALKTAIAKSSRTDITQADMNSLLEFMQSKYTPDQLESLKSGFDALHTLGRPTVYQDPFRYITGPTTEESRDIVQRRRALANWLAGRISRKKETMLEDIVNKAMELVIPKLPAYGPQLPSGSVIQMYSSEELLKAAEQVNKELKAVEDLPEPKSRQEFLSTLKALDVKYKGNTNISRDYYYRWVDKFTWENWRY